MWLLLTGRLAISALLEDPRKVRPRRARCAHSVKVLPYPPLGFLANPGHEVREDIDACECRRCPIKIPTLKDRECLADLEPEQYPTNHWCRPMGTVYYHRIIFDSDR